MTYVARNEYGRYVHASSLQECLEGIAFVSHKNPNLLVTVQDKDGKHFYVYANQATLDAYAADWFATIEVVP